jgi:hypothetical protein
MGGGSSKPKHIDPVRINVNNYKENKEDLINNPPEKFINYNNYLNYCFLLYYLIFIVITIIIFLLLFYT